MLTLAQIRELDALRRFNDALKGPSFLMRSYYRDPVIGPLIRRGLISWGPHPEMSRKFAATEITPAGRNALDAARRAADPQGGQG